MHVVGHTVNGMNIPFLAGDLMRHVEMNLLLNIRRDKGLPAPGHTYEVIE
jgi:hypothetical protein